MNRERFYLALPPWLQNVVCSLEGWRIARTRYGSEFWRQLQAAEDRCHWPEEQVSAFRDSRIHVFVNHCYATSPWYKAAFDRIGLIPSDVKSLRDLEQVPILLKSEVQRGYGNLVSRAVPTSRQIIHHTSGTTGGGLRFATTLAATQEQWAIWWRYRRWHAIQPDTWCGYFGGRSVVPLSQRGPPFWRINWPGRQILFSAYHMSEKNMLAYVNKLRKQRPPWLHGYPSLLALLAGFMKDRGLDVGYQVNVITTGAENLLLQQKALIERAFGVAPRQHYGMAEAVANISECELGNLHVDEDFSAVEFVPGESGTYKVIGTNFSNMATPLLRYDVQDNATPSDAVCSCGRWGRLVASVDGRLEDYVILKNGAKLGRLDHVFKDLINIQEAQIAQRRAGAITLRVVRGAGYTESDEALLLREFRQRVGEEADIEIDYVGALDRTASGKLRFVVSEIPESKLGS